MEKIFIPFNNKIMKLSELPNKNKSIEIVKLTTSCWRSNRGIHIRRDITTQKRLSDGYQVLMEDAEILNADEIFHSITNLDDCQDGLYVVETTNIIRDWETGYIDSYDYKLIPFNP